MDYHAPGSLDEALGLLARKNMRVIAGGTDVYPAMAAGGPGTNLLDVTGIAGMRGIDRTSDGWRIGAATTWSDVARAELPRAMAGLQAAARQVGSLQIQNAGTVGGNICNASPAADGVPPLLTLGAEVEVAGPGALRRIPLQAFLKGVRQTALAPGEMVVALHLPEPPVGAVGLFDKLGSREYLVISIAMVAMVVGCDAQGQIERARVAVGACSPIAMRLEGLEAEMIGKRPDEVVVEPDHLAGLRPIDDVRGSAGYRLEAVREMIRRMLAEGTP
ncbi:xanthine dehydrogenase family protein subunit M [Alisedimentitalea sp. MJ-SS2]|uniref:FAD binding domain-containing protein n=1 Tax=Aliisedimentitalea sp. MJ-SS2 TaxID=3049795 RepID=UPI00290FF5D1|nr:xanthine dehydrogenase family protein subunit M [Alisedimentitalea sp. MJ-SS2]MDU8929875.1 xanthine dehydrogenase family protein subunit M [Alisedimentitalea sp. MJ-SS2]